MRNRILETLMFLIKTLPFYIYNVNAPHCNPKIRKPIDISIEFQNETLFDKMSENVMEVRT